MVRLCQNDIREAQGKSMPPEIKTKRFLEGKIALVKGASHGITFQKDSFLHFL